MRQLLFLWVFFLFVLRLEAKIVEVKTLEDVLPHVDSQTLVVLDLDDTLMIPKQMLGGDCWLRTEVSKLQSQGWTVEEALAKLMPDYFNIQHTLEVLPVELTTAQVVHQLQQKADRVIGLTTRSPELAYRTIQQLKSIDVDLSLKPLSDPKHQLNTFFPFAYIQGILFTQSLHKGKVLHNLCKHLGYKPQKVIFINDKYKYVMQLEETFANLKIPYVGFRYAACDGDIKRYDSKVAAIQHQYFNSILSNEDASFLLHHFNLEEDL